MGKGEGEGKPSKRIVFRASIDNAARAISKAHCVNRRVYAERQAHLVQCVWRLCHHCGQGVCQTMAGQLKAFVAGRHPATRTRLPEPAYEPLWNATEALLK